MTKHTNKKYALLAILPLISLLFFFYTMHGMQRAEHALITLYSEHTNFIEELAANPLNRENLTAQFAEKIMLDATEQNTIKRSARIQKILDTITFSTPHCLNDPRSTNCKVYTPDLPITAKNRYGKLLLLTGQEPPRESILSGTAYTPKDHARTVFILILEGLALTSAAIWIWSRK